MIKYSDSIILTKYVKRYSNIREGNIVTKVGEESIFIKYFASIEPINLFFQISVNFLYKRCNLVIN